MATGDVRGNLERLKVQLRSISYPHALDTQGCRDGLPAAILPLIHYALLGYSRHLARYLSVNGYVLYAKSDLRFVECVMKLLRKEFEYRCPLTVAQIFARGFAEKKFLFVHDLIQMCKRKHNDLLRIVRNAEKKTKVCLPKAFGRVIHPHQKPAFIRNKHLSSKFDRRCELDLLPDSKCHEICRRSTCQESSWERPVEGTTTVLSAIADDEESTRAQSFERAKHHELKVLARSQIRNVDENCHLHAAMFSSKCSPRRTVMMGAQMIHKEYGYGSLLPERVPEANYDPATNSPRSSCPGFNHQKQENTSDGENTTTGRPATRASQEDSAGNNTKVELSKGERPNSAIVSSPDHSSESVEEPVTSKKAEGQLQTPSIEPVTRLQKSTCQPQENCPHVQLHENRSSPLEDATWPNAPTHSTTDDPPQAVWEKIIDLAGKIDSCFFSLDNKIAHSFTSLDDKLETKFKVLDEGVTCTRETLQEKLSILENRIDNLERTSQISPMSFQTNVTYNDDGHPIRDITNTFNSFIDNGSWRNFPGMQPREPLMYYPNLYQQQQAMQNMQNIQNIPPMYAGLLKASTQDFIANVRARFDQTKEMLRMNEYYAPYVMCKYHSDQRSVLTCSLKKCSFLILKR